MFGVIVSSVDTHTTLSLLYLLLCMEVLWWWGKWRSCPIYLWDKGYVLKSKIQKSAAQSNRTVFTRKGTRGLSVLQKFALFQAYVRWICAERPLSTA